MYLFNQDGSATNHEHITYTSPRARGVQNGLSLLNPSVLLSQESEAWVNQANTVLGEILKFVNIPSKTYHTNVDYLRDLPSHLASLFALDMQGFPGPLPVTFGRNRSDLVSISLYLPADGALLRYFQRMFRVVNAGQENQFISARYVSMPSTETSARIRAINGHEATLQPVNVMCVIIDISFYADIHGRSPVPWLEPSTLAVLHSLRRALLIRRLMPSIMQVMRTLVRKMVSIDGSWGELPKFPIVNLFTKRATGTFGRDRIDIHGNDPVLFADKEVYFATEFSQKAIFQTSESETEKFQWIEPK